VIKLRKRGRTKRATRYYVLARTNSVSPDYLGLQVTYGLGNGQPGQTRTYWFRSYQNGRGKTVSARQQRQRKVRALVLKRLRNGYELVRKCDPWCRKAVQQSIAASQRPKKTGTFRPVSKQTKVWERAQLCFEF
jgi:hypothetical protein